MSDRRGRRALGIADSSVGDRCTLAGAVVRGDRVVDGAGFATATVGGLDATDAVLRIVTALDREDVASLVIGTIAPARFNVIDLSRLYEGVDGPTIAVTFDPSDGLEPAIRDSFSGDDRSERLERYRRLPPRRPVTVNDETVYVRALGASPAEAADIVRTFTPEGGRPEPIRVARQLARAGAAYLDRERDADRPDRSDR
ncbi:DUF99 family protein [Halovivax cerinus]|uniref:UPF0215 protein ACFOUR_14410 n=1 Tax=Halovivax cerinus TaxID=1487865 RepID=A0ABD5NR95_9EURY|nr:DUF99 family protein [Halovivax cerinus]